MLDVILYSSGELQNGMLIHTAETADRLRKLPSGVIVDADNAISSFTFEIFSGNPGYAHIHERTTHIRVYDRARGKYVFTGRVLDVSREMESEGLVYRTVTCEDRRGYLQDSVQPFEVYQFYEGDDLQTGLEQFIDLMLENHRARTEAYKWIYRGEVSVQTYKTTDNTSKQLNWQSTWQCLTEKLIGSFGGHLVLRETDGTLYLDYLDDVGETSDTVIRVGRNMLSVRELSDTKGIVTRLTPLGAKLKVVDDDGNEEETDERLTIAAVNDGLDYIDALGYIDEYGVIAGTETWDDVTDPGNLLRKATDYLAARNAVSVSVDVAALDLSLLGLDEDDFSLYARHRVVNELLGIDEYRQIVKKTTDIIEPLRSSFVLGDASKSLSDSLLDQRSQTRQTIDSAMETVRSQVQTAMTSYVETHTKTLRDTVEGLEASYGRQSESLSDLGAFRESLINLLTADASSTTFTFAQVIEALTGSGPDQMNYWKTLLTYIRFSINGIEIGRQSDPVVLKLANSRISFQNNGLDVAYISDNKLYIKDAQFLTSIIIGNYQFILEDNGSLSLVLAGG